MTAQQIFLAGPYNALYASGFIATCLIVYWRGRHSGLRPQELVIFLSVCATAGIIGSHFLPFDLIAPEAGEKTVLGGAVAVVLAALAARWFLRLDARVTDALGVALPAGFAIGRIGCFLAGCCFGTPTSLPWGVRYSAGTEPFLRQVALGLIDPSAATTLPVHPTQLYEAGSALLIALAAAILLRRGRKDILVSSVIVPFFGIRFVLQFLRGHESGGFGVVQVVLVLSAALLWAASTWVAQHPAPARKPVGYKAVAVVLICVLALVAETVTPLELATLVSLGFLAVAVMTRSHWKQFRTVPAFAALMALQQADSTPAGARRYITAGASGMSGQYVETCGGAHRYAMGGGSLAYTTVPSPKTEWTVKGQLFAGSDRNQEAYEQRYYYNFGGLYTDSVAIDPSAQLFGGSLSFSGRYNWFGGTIGFTAGDLYFDGDRTNVLPILGLTFGTPRFFVESRFADFEPAAVPAPVIQLGIGARVSAEGSTLRVGLSDAGFYGSGLIVTHDWEVEPRIAFGDQNTHQLGIAIRKRFPLKRF